MKAYSKVNNAELKKINSNSTMALIKTADALKTDLIQSQTMPFGKTRYVTINGEKVKHQGGTLQNTSTFVDDKQSHQGVVSVVSDTPYARRLYFHPEYNFDKSNNPNAGGMWFEPYIEGNKKDFVKNTFKQFMKGQL